MKYHLRFGLTALLGCGIASGCSGSGNTNGTGNGLDRRDGSVAGSSGRDGGDVSGGGAGGSGTSGSGAGGNEVGTSADGGLVVTTVTPVTATNACVSQKDKATPEALDIFIMQDRSGSMGDATAAGPSKWTVITGALTKFVNDKQSAGIGAGIGFFAVETPAAADAGGGHGRHGGGNGGGNDSCNAADYAIPDVPIANLNGNAAAIVKAIGNISPSGDTPTEPALQGAIDYAQTWQKAHPTHKVVVVFATDGLPNGCNSTVAGAAAIAKTGDSGATPIETYVVGVFGSTDCPNGLNQSCTVVTNVNEIAKSGGTGSAFIVNTGANTETEFENAMNAIRNANNVACDYDVPPAPNGKAVDLTRATVEYTSGTAAAVDLAWASSASACDSTSGGWYYDGTVGQAKIHLCPVTCTKVEADSNASIQLLLACEAPGSSGAGGGGGVGNAGGASSVGDAGPGTGGAGGTSACLLDGQSCSTSADCCSKSCVGGVCNPAIH